MRERSGPELLHYLAVEESELVALGFEREDEVLAFEEDSTSARMSRLWVHRALEAHQSFGFTLDVRDRNVSVVKLRRFLEPADDANAPRHGTNSVQGTPRAGQGPKSSAGEQKL